MRTALFGVPAAVAVLALVATSTPAQGQEKAAPKYVAPKTADGHPDM